MSSYPNLVNLTTLTAVKLNASCLNPFSINFPANACSKEFQYNPDYARIESQYLEEVVTWADPS